MKDKELFRVWFSWLKHLYRISCGRIHKDLVDPEKLQATLAEDIVECHDLKRALEMVTLLDAQLKEMNPNLDSITE